MASLNIQSFATLLSNQIAAVQTACNTLISFTFGSVLRAITSSNSAVGLWLQGIALQVLSLTRFATSYGSDADTFGADWNYFRAAATPSTGFVTFQRAQPYNFASFIPVGSLVMTADNTEQFQVLADTTNPAYSASPSPGGFTIAALATSVTCLVQSVNASPQANVAPGFISKLVSSIAGIDTVTNSAATAGGNSPESDANFKSGFPAYLQSLARGTPAAITSAMSSLQSGMEITLLENKTFAGATQNGFLTLIVDDGSGSPPGLLVTNAGNQANLYRAAGIQIGVFGPTIVTVAVTYTITSAPTFNHAAMVTASQNAVQTFIDSLQDGKTLAWSQLFQVIYDAVPGGIIDVTNLLINGATADIVPAQPYDVIKYSSVVGT